MSSRDWMVAGNEHQTKRLFFASINIPENVMIDKLTINDCDYCKLKLKFMSFDFNYNLLTQKNLQCLLLDIAHEQ